MVNFNVSPEEFGIIQRIVARAEKMAIDAGVRLDRMTTMMDLEATHANGCPLRLVSLLEAPDFDFAHDVFGISKHINRKTGHLENCFVPRFAQPEPASASEVPA